MCGLDVFLSWVIKEKGHEERGAFVPYELRNTLQKKNENSRDLFEQDQILLGTPILDYNINKPNGWTELDKELTWIFFSVSQYIKGTQKVTSFFN